MIGQSQVTDPLMTALRNDRVGHAYLFSGPRGCGKTTSARILARCLNCAEGPTDTPCGTCPSCVELSRSGGGSLDVVEIDAASHNGVDDARDLRERAIFAPARDRFKIFILDEAHMVTQQGFNALLKLVEEPPDHVKFIFATTEPEKVLGTIRSRTHHYPFRLVPPGPMLDYVGELCQQEGVRVDAGVLPLVVRAGGGSPRDTLSVLDQLIAGSEGGEVTYARAVALLGYTHAELLDEVVDALADLDAGAAFAAIDRVVQTGQDPRRFVDDLLERLRDLIIVDATGAGARAVLRGVPDEEIERMGRQAGVFGGARLSRVADLVGKALDDMTGATSPRLHLELMVARVLADAQTAGEHTVSGQGVAAAGPASGGGRASAAASGSAAAASAGSAPAVAAKAPESTAAAAPASPTPAPASVASASGVPASRPTATATAAPAPAPTSAEAAPTGPSSSEPAAAAALPSPQGPVDIGRLRDAWPEVLQALEQISRSAWLVASGARIVGLNDDVLSLGFATQADLTAFKPRPAGSGASDDLRQAIEQVLGLRVKFIARADRGGNDDRASRADEAPGSRGPAGGANAPTGGRTAASAGATASGSPSSGASGAVADWAVAAIPTSDEAEADPDPAPSARASAALSDGVHPWATAPGVAPARSAVAVETASESEVAAAGIDPGQHAAPADMADAHASSPARPAAPAPRGVTADGWADAPADDEWYHANVPDDEWGPADIAPATAPQDPTAPQASQPTPAASALAVDDEPGEVGARWQPAPRDGDVLARSEASTDRDDDDDEGDSLDIVGPATIAPAPIPEPRRPAADRGGSTIDRYGEAVVRQVLGGRFVREEPYEPPARFR